MIRIARVKKENLSPRALRISTVLNDICAKLASALGAPLASVIAAAQDDGEYVNFFSKNSGAIDEISIQDLKSSNIALYNLFNEQCSLIKSYLLSDSADPFFAQYKDDIIYFIDNVPCLVVIENAVCSIVINESREAAAAAEAAKAAAAAAAPAAAAAGAASHTMCYIAAALALLLLLLALLWWLFLRPWPFSGSCANFFADLPPALEYISDTEQKKLDELNAFLDASKEDSIQKDSEIARLNEELKKKELEAKEMQEHLLKQKDIEIEKLKEDLKKSNEQKSAASVPASASASDSKKPKCSDLKKNSKFPRLVIAFDGSESMLSNDIDYNVQHNRLNLAKKAVGSIVPRIDKRVNIGLIEINGCPLAKNKGFFASNARGALIAEVMNIDPYRYDGKTPLSSGIMQIANSVDGVDSDDVGILISDGEDTCYGAELCSLARSIHRAKPRLKIHVLSISQDISNVRCVADITGGKIFEPQNAGDFTKQLNSLSSDMNQGQICKD